MATQGWKRLPLIFFLLLLCILIVAIAEIFFHRPRLGQTSQWALPLFGSACDPFTPVCAEGNVSYKSACQALAADATILRTGACGDEIKKPVTCTVNCFRADPVCGADNVTYWCGAAEAKCAGVKVAHEGYCDIWEGGPGVGSTGLHAAQSLQLVHMVWLVLAGLLIVLGLP